MLKHFSSSIKLNPPFGIANPYASSQLLCSPKSTSSAPRLVFRASFPATFADFTAAAVAFLGLFLRLSGGTKRECPWKSKSLTSAW